MIFEYFLVFVLGLLAGGWATAAGVLFGLNPVGVYVAAVAGSLGFSLIFLALGAKFRERVMRRFPGSEDRVASSRAGEFLDRWGVPGLAIIGGTVLGPSLTLLAALTLGVDLQKFRLWYVLATVIGFALMTWFWIIVVG